MAVILSRSQAGGARSREASSRGERLGAEPPCAAAAPGNKTPAASPSAAPSQPRGSAPGSSPTRWRSAARRPHRKTQHREAVYLGPKLMPERSQNKPAANDLHLTSPVQMSGERPLVQVKSCGARAARTHLAVNSEPQPHPVQHVVVARDRHAMRRTSLICPIPTVQRLCLPAAGCRRSVWAVCAELAAPAGRTSGISQSTVRSSSSSPRYSMLL